ncbi:MULTISPECIES: hypothetical protein [Pseudofrankia]|uniref:hypothetical protein n=1 Tax=Pseudofrankia TaxID=2994363 RepID=UPI000234CAEC|nr:MULTISPECIES: hypothetical protein [Pseudofrankia]OHV37684.1 hypothetical protein BCD49_03480 [Pseudofrankia sp. EUN1h]
MRRREADTLLRFVRVARPVAATAVSVTTADDGEDGGRRAQADRIVRHWRNELVPLAALPGVGGRFTQPIREVLAGTVQGLLVLSLAQLCGVTDEGEQVRLVAALMLREDLPAGWTPPVPDPAHSTVATDDAATATATDDAATAEVADVTDDDARSDGGGAGGGGPAAGGALDATEAAPSPEAATGTSADAGTSATTGTSAVAGGTVDPRDADEESATWRLVARQIPVAVYRAARELWTIHSLSGQRAEGRLWHRALGNLPAVGVVGATLGERHALADIAAAAYIELGLTAVEAPGPSVAARAATAAKGVAAQLPALGRAVRSPFRKP